MRMRAALSLLLYDAAWMALLLTAAVSWRVAAAAAAGRHAISMEVEVEVRGAHAMHAGPSLAAARPCPAVDEQVNQPARQTPPAQHRQRRFTICIARRDDDSRHPRSPLSARSALLATDNHEFKPREAACSSTLRAFLVASSGPSSSS
ncbi:hypothetical protein IE81DRAFT_127673 [Ceraceosorus guamensis]|uniref:Secreted protein n=1 Tax=Ceraceosorus guamensis TaxID=1522189 RepID=A0A316W7B5_9BASI|nr:hypothetical protein IE81DRAFT_127673 [Ceraceosorus guamensis]PWN45836.1 hypothetical protein IE81DRAFT_127673 [Ceraceosorus guamensis]